MMNTPDAIHVCIVHPDSLVRPCLANALSRAPGIEVCVSVPDLAGLQTWAADQDVRPDVLVADYEPGLTLAQRAARESHGAPVIVISGFDREWELRKALSQRVRGYLIPGFEFERLDEGVRAVHAGRRYLCMRAAARLAESLSYEALTEREAEVLTLVVRGEPNKIISRRLTISIATVKSHIKSAYAKLGVASRTQAIVLAERRGMLRRDAEADAAPWLMSHRPMPTPPRASLERLADLAFG